MSATPAASLASTAAVASSGRSTVSIAPTVRLVAHIHGQRSEVDLSGGVLSVQMSHRMSAPFSVAQVALKLDRRQTVLSFLDRMADDDWIEVHGSTRGGDPSSWVPLFVGPADSIRSRMVVDNAGTERWTLNIAARGWSKLLTDTTVSTWQKWTDRGYTGSILPPSRAEQLTRDLLSLLNKGQTPSLQMSKLLWELLQGQWNLPTSMALQFDPSGVRRTFAELMWPFSASSVQTLGGPEVDGVAWRGLSLAGGIRGTLWNVLQAFQSDPALVELWPGHTVGPVAGMDRLLPVLCYRKRPFRTEFDGTDQVASFVVPFASVASLDLGKSGTERFNVGLVSPSIAMADFEQATMALSDELPFVATDERNGILRHGTRGWFVTDALTPPDDQFITDRPRSLTRFLSDAYLASPDFLNGSMVVVGMVIPPTVVGSRLALTDGNGSPMLEFYCEGLDTRFDVTDRGAKTMSQTVSLTRGRSLV